MPSNAGERMQNEINALRRESAELRERAECAEAERDEWEHTAQELAWVAWRLPHQPWCLAPAGKCECEKTHGAKYQNLAEQFRRKLDAAESEET